MPGDDPATIYPYRGQEFGTWERPSLEDCVEQTYIEAIGAEGDALIYRHRRRLQDDTLGDFAIVLLVLGGGSLHQAAEIDVCHGSLHVHHYDRYGTKHPAGENLRPISTQADLDDAYDQAFELMMAQWEGWKRRWRDG
jgi:hypothetical protein